MAFFENLSKKVQDVAFAAAEKGKEVAAVASEKAQDAADTVKTNVAIASEQRSIEKNYRAIGEWYVSGLGDEVPAPIADIVKAIRQSREKIVELQKSKETPVACECVCQEPKEESVPCESAAAAAPVEEATAEDFADTPAKEE